MSYHTKIGYKVHCEECYTVIRSSLFDYDPHKKIPPIRQAKGTAKPIYCPKCEKGVEVYLRPWRGDDNNNSETV